MQKAPSMQLAETAALLGRGEDWLRRNWLRIHERHGFPRKHPTGWTWPRAAVEAWLASECPADLPEAANDDMPPVSDPLVAYGQLLEQRYGGGQ